MRPTLSFARELYGTAAKAGAKWGPGSVGFSVSIHADTAVLGAPNETVNGLLSAGAAYVFFRIGTAWTEQKRLLPDEPLAGANFGTSVSIHGDTLIVGAHREGDSGATHVFFRNDSDWSPQQRLSSDNVTIDARFGGAVALEKDTILVGAQKDGGGGSVSVFERNGTVWELRLPGIVPTPASSIFWNSVSLNEGTAVVGALLESQPNTSFAGASFVFIRAGTTWEQQQNLLPRCPRPRAVSEAVWTSQGTLSLLAR